MIGKCRKCGELIFTQTVCEDTAAEGDAVVVGLEMMQATRAHFRSVHPADTWIVAESIGQLGALFPFLAGVDVDQRQRAVLLLTYHALKAQLFSVSFNASAGAFGVPGAADAEGVSVLSAPVADPLIQSGRIEVLEELAAAGVPGLGPKLERERAALRLMMEVGRVVLPS